METGGERNEQSIQFLSRPRRSAGGGFEGKPRRRCWITRLWDVRNGESPLKMFDDILNEAEADLRELLNIPDDYKVLFLQGGASLQFAQIP